MPGIEMLSSKGLVVILVSIFTQSLINPAFILFVILANVLFWFLKPKNRNPLNRLLLLLVSTFSPFIVSYLLETLMVASLTR